MLKREIKVLKYIKKHPDVTHKNLCKKFSSFKDDYNQISQYVSISNPKLITINGLETGETQADDTSTYQLNRKGELFFEDKSNKFWNFVLPYTITTIIAISSLIAQILK